jgi:hypothetical protein
MRFKGRNVLAALVAALALTAVTAASASAALPEFTGSFPNTVTFAGSHEVTLESVEGTDWITCQTTTGSGSITGAKALTATLTFKNCVDRVRRECNEIKTEALKSSLVYIAKASKEVGIDFNQQTGQPVFASFICTEGGSGLGSIHVTVRDGVVAQVTAVNTKTKKYTVNFKVEGGRQKPLGYENEAGKKVNTLLQIEWLSNGFQEQGDLKDELTMTTGLETEVKA